MCRMRSFVDCFMCMKLGNQTGATCSIEAVIYELTTFVLKLMISGLYRKRRLTVLDRSKGPKLLPRSFHCVCSVIISFLIYFISPSMKLFIISYKK